MQRQFTYLFALNLLLSIALSVSAASQTYTTIDYPGAVFTLITDINDVGQIVGEYTFSTLGNRQGFLLSNGIFTSITYPSATFTRAVAINRYGDIVGDHQKTGNNNSGGNDYGYLLRGGVFTLIVFPQSDTTVPTAINDNGDIAGWYVNNAGTHGFVLHNGVYSSIDFPGSAAFTEVWKINNYGLIAGRYRSSTDRNYHLFTLGNGHFTSFPDVPGSMQTAPGNFSEDGGLNDAGDIAGHYCSAKPCSLGSLGTLHGFLLSGGSYAMFDYPGAVATLVFGLDSADDVVGVYQDSSGIYHGYVRRP